MVQSNADLPCLGEGSLTMAMSPERIETLRRDPDFRLLVNCLRQQSEESVQSFLEFFGVSEHERPDNESEIE